MNSLHNLVETEDFIREQLRNRNLRGLPKKTREATESLAEEGKASVISVPSAEPPRNDPRSRLLTEEVWTNLYNDLVSASATLERTLALELNQQTLRVLRRVEEKEGRSYSRFLEKSSVRFYFEPREATSSSAKTEVTPESLVSRLLTQEGGGTTLWENLQGPSLQALRSDTRATLALVEVQSPELSETLEVVRRLNGILQLNNLSQPSSESIHSLTTLLKKRYKVISFKGIPGDESSLILEKKKIISELLNKLSRLHDYSFQLKNCLLNMVDTLIHLKSQGEGPNPTPLEKAVQELMDPQRTPSSLTIRITDHYLEIPEIQPLLLLKKEIESSTTETFFQGLIT